MAEDQQEQDRSEAPSQFKLARARRKGAVARGADLGFLASLTAFTLFIWLRGDAIGAALSVDVTRAFTSAAGVNDSASALLALVGDLLVTIVRPLSDDWAAERGARGVFFIVEPNRAQLGEIARLIDEGRVQTVVEAVYPLADARRAYERGISESPRGKLVLRVANED